MSKAQVLRETTIGVRLTPDEKRQLDAASRMAGVKMSTFARQAALKAVRELMREAA